MNSNTEADLLLRERHLLTEDAFAELVVWRVPKPKRGSRHPFKYRLAYVVAGVCVLRFDNEAGKGDHVHVGGLEAPYAFTTPEKLLADFWQSVAEWRSE